MDKKPTKSTKSTKIYLTIAYSINTNNKITYLVTGQLQQTIIIINMSLYELFRIRY